MGHNHFVRTETCNMIITKDIYYHLTKTMDGQNAKNTAKGLLYNT